MNELDEMGNEYDRVEKLTQEEFRRLWLRTTSSQSYQLARIETKVDKTNGRVRSLELWRAGLAGGVAVIAAIVVPLFLEVVGRN